MCSEITNEPCPCRGAVAKRNPSIVVHVDDETHASAVAFCKKNDLRMKRWVSALIARAVRKKTLGFPR
jgi:hypothetical protein